MGKGSGWPGTKLARPGVWMTRTFFRKLRNARKAIIKVHWLKRNVGLRLGSL